MLENCADDRGNCNASIVVEIAFVALTVLYDWHNGSLLKLIGNEPMQLT